EEDPARRRDEAEVAADEEARVAEAADEAAVAARLEAGEVGLGDARLALGARAARAVGALGADLAGGADGDLLPGGDGDAGRAPAVGGGDGDPALLRRRRRRRDLEHELGDVAEAPELEGRAAEELLGRKDLLADDVELAGTVPVDDGDAGDVGRIGRDLDDEREAPHRLELAGRERRAEGLARDLEVDHRVG